MSITKPIARPHRPGPLERLLGRLGYAKFRPASVIHRVEASAAWPDPAPALAAEIGHAAHYAGAYAGNPWVYVAVNRIAEAAALVPFRVLLRAGEHAVEVPDHPFERLLRRPNPLLSRFELIEQTVGCLEIHGNAYWFLAGQPGGGPQEIWPLRPDRVLVVPDARQGVRGYIYEIDGRRVPLDAGEVVHFRRWHPANDYYGLSALEAARLAVDTDRAMADWNRRYFGEGLAVPAGIVAIRERVSDADYERLKAEWRTAYGGRERKTAFLRGASVEWHNVGLSQQDMDFLNARRFNREEVFQIFGIPVGMFSENATEANAQVGERVFIERTLWPKLVRIAEKISTDLLPFYAGNLVGQFDDIRPQDRSDTFAEMQAARGVLSVNEIRARYFQLPPVVWGEGPEAAVEPAPMPDGIAAEDAQAGIDAPPFDPDVTDPVLDLGGPVYDELPLPAPLTPPERPPRTATGNGSGKGHGAGPARALTAPD